MTTSGHHPECWAECRPTYGGCAVYGCGSPSGHPIGRFALRRRALRLLVAAVLFPPQAVKRLRATDPRTFRELWREARDAQRALSAHAPGTILVGLLDALIVVPPSAWLSRLLAGWLFRSGTLREDELGVAIGLLICLVAFLVPAALAIALMRLPRVVHFGWGLTRLVARAFKDELAALARADQGTFLARLAAGLGKKDAAD